MIFNSLIYNSGADDEETAGGVAAVTVFNNKKLDVLVKEDVSDYGFWGYHQSYGAYLKNVKLDDTVKKIGSYGFQNQYEMQLTDFNKVEQLSTGCCIACRGLTSPVMENVKTIGYNAFANCTSLLEVNLPNIETIDGGARNTATFYNCTALEKVVFGEKLKELGSGNCHVFNANNNIISIHLPASLEKIANYAFYNCENLTNVTVGEGFNVSLNLGLCGDLTQESLENIVGNYAEASGKILTVTSSTYTLATETLFTGSELTIAEYASAKGLTIASS